MKTDKVMDFFWLKFINWLFVLNAVLLEPVLLSILAWLVGFHRVMGPIQTLVLIFILWVINQVRPAYDAARDDYIKAMHKAKEAE